MTANDTDRDPRPCAVMFSHTPAQSMEVHHFT